MTTSAARITTPVPPLVDGDKLTSREFMRRYEATPEGFRAELLDGVVFVNRVVTAGPDGEILYMAPIGGGGHGLREFSIQGFLFHYSIHTPHVVGSGPTTLHLAVGAVVEPDAMVYVEETAGGRLRLGEDDYFRGPPDLVVEVSNSSARHDLGAKLELYRQYGVKEYLVWRVRDCAIDWFRRGRDGAYLPIPPDDAGIVRSRALPGLWLDVPAILAGDLARGLVVVQEGLASAEHAKFAAKLVAKAAKASA